MSDEKLVVLLMIVVNGLGLWLLERFRPHSSESGLDRRRHLATNLALSGLLITLNFAFDGAAAAGSPTMERWLRHPEGRPLAPLDEGSRCGRDPRRAAYLAHVLMHKLSLSGLNAQLEHADIPLPCGLDRSLRVVLATPAMHRVHHSRAQAENDTNYSNIFSIWDRLFGTYRPPRPGDKIVFGLDGCDAPERQRTAGLLTLPFGS